MIDRSDKMVDRGICSQINIWMNEQMNGYIMQNMYIILVNRWIEENDSYDRYDKQI